MEPRYEEETEWRGWFSRQHLSWPMLFVAGWLLYEFTAQPGLGAFVACAKFGWADIRTGFWLRRVDPNRWRGQTCFWSYLTYGIWKVAALATLSIIAVGLLYSCLIPLRAQQAGMNHLFSLLRGAGSAVLLGFGLSVPTAYISLWSARRNGVRIWLGNAAVRARKERFWPPNHGQTNMAYFVYSTTLIMTVVVLIVTSLALIPVLMKFVPAVVVSALSITAFLASFVLPPVILWKGQVLFARTPEECWFALDDERVHQVDSAEGEGVEA